MATITTRSGKGSPLTNTEVDNNFTNLNTDKVEKSGDTLTGDLAFGDNVDAKFGAGTDLVLTHNGTNSLINNNTGNLIIQQFANDGDVVINSDDGSGSTANYFRADGSNGEAVLYHYGSQKLATKSTGIQTTGTLDVNGAYTLPTSDGTNGQVLTTDGSGAVTFQDASGGGGGISSGTTAERPASPSIGDIRYNTDERQFEAYRNQIDSSLSNDWYPLSPWELLEEGSFTGINNTTYADIGARYYPNETVTGRENFTYTSFKLFFTFSNPSTNSGYSGLFAQFGYQNPTQSTGGAVTGFQVEGHRYRRDYNNQTSTSILRNAINTTGVFTPFVYASAPGMFGGGWIEFGTNFKNIGGPIQFQSQTAHCRTAITDHHWVRCVGTTEGFTSAWSDQSPVVRFNGNSSTNPIDLQFRLYGLRGIS